MYNNVLVADNIYKRCIELFNMHGGYIYKEYMFSILFLRYISDLNESGIKEISIIERNGILMVAKNVPHKVLFYNVYQDCKKGFAEKKVGRALMTINKIICELFPDKQDYLFENISSEIDNLINESAKNNIINELFYIFSTNELDFSYSNNGINKAKDMSDYFIEKLSYDFGRKGRYIDTPKSIAMLVSKIIEPNNGDSIYDPACGAGELLIELDNYIKNNKKMKFNKLFGQDINQSNWFIANINMLLHDKLNSIIELGDSIRYPKFTSDDNQLTKFDVVASIPPFNSSNWGYEDAVYDKYNRFLFGIPPKSKGDYAFILHMIASLRDNTGRMAVVVPQGVLFRGGSEGIIRKELVENTLLDAVILLPKGLFNSTSISVSILVFKKNRVNKNILFVDASDYFETKNRRVCIGKRQLDRIVSVYFDRRNVNSLSYVSSIDEVRENDYSLNVPLYVKNIKENEYADINIRLLKKNRDLLMSKLNELESEMNKIIHFMN
ncbi:N-6 DNA methylase [Morganella morganii]|uniref:N-6 DNA methylase n=1 Tax=Morganella morganii TaxID=582 RepID=UPI003D7FDA85